MRSKVKLAIVTDNPPVRADVKAWGMCRVNTRLFRALSENIVIIISGSQRYMYSSKDLDDNTRARCIIGSSIPTIIKQIGVVFPTIINEELEFKINLSRYLKKIHNSSANWIFCPCGVNPHSLYRGIRLAQACNLPIAVYLVDDFLSGAELSGDTATLRTAQQDIPLWLKQVDQIFVISDGLKSRIRNLYNLDSVVLPLPYALGSYDKPPGNSLEQTGTDQEVIFVGNLSHFYTDGLKQMAQTVDEINSTLGSNIKLRLTLPSIKDAQHKIGHYDCIKCKPCVDNLDLYHAIHSSILCFAPYSFREDYKIMVSTSFPSKILDYLSAARHILILGPPYATSVNYFNKNQLNTVLTSENPKKIREIIIRQLNDNMEYSNKYREVVWQNHDPKQVALQIISTLESHAHPCRGRGE